MKYSSFTALIEERVQERYGKEKNVFRNTIIKNNDVELDALEISSPSEKATPTIYLNDFYEDYKQGKSLDSIVETICNIYDNRIPLNDNCTNIFSDFENVKKNLAFKLVNFEKNEKFLKDVPYIKFLDFAIIFYCLISDKDCNAMAVIHNHHAKAFGVDEKDLYKIAFENTPKILPYILSPMEEILKKLLIINSGPEEDPDFTFDKLFGTKKSGMYVLSNTKNFNGSAVMLYKDVLKDIATALGNVDLYIIPSSVHELIILPDLGTMDKKALTAMVRDVNASEVAESEILSDHAYFYNHEEGKLYA